MIVNEIPEKSHELRILDMFTPVLIVQILCSTKTRVMGLFGSLVRPATKKTSVCLSYGSLYKLQVMFSKSK